MSVYCECCVLAGRGLCDELITCPTECGASRNLKNEKVMARVGPQRYRIMKIVGLKPN